MNLIEEIIVSSDSNPMFLNYWPVVARSWEKIFGLTPTLVLIKNGDLDESTLKKIESFGKVLQIQELDGIPPANQAKMARWYYASQAQSKIVSIEDIDTIFLKADFLNDRLAEFEPDKLYGIGCEVYDFHEGIMKFPASNLTGQGYLFADLFHYKTNMSFRDFIFQFQDLQICDHLENPFNTPSKFSDESLIRALRVKNNFTQIKVVERNIDIKSEWLDRSWWPRDKQLNLDSYTTVNFLRPLWENYSSCKPILDIFFFEDYPWIIPSKTKITKNRDNIFLKTRDKCKYFLKKRINQIIKNPHKRASRA